MNREDSSLVQGLISGLTWFASHNQETQMHRRRVERAKAKTGMNPLWIIAVAMAIFFAAATAILALT